MRRAVGIAGCTLAAIGFGGCYASTEPATDVGETTATLRAQGHANNGAAYSFFEYWQDSNPSLKHRTSERQWPAGAKSAFSTPVELLGPARSFSFRVCGGDQANPADPVCAQTRSFTTKTPTGDVATGFLQLGSGAQAIIVRFLASSGPSGQNPSGTAVGPVTCLSVSGNHATIGSDTQSRDGMLIWATEDPPGSGSGQITFSVDLPTPVDCSTPVGGAGGSTFSGPSDQVAIYDTLSPTARR
jgi:hypothetical protein